MASRSFSPAARCFACPTSMKAFSPSSRPFCLGRAHELAALVRNTLGMDPLGGGLFLFLSKRNNRVKFLFWDRDGYALFYKRLEKGCFARPRPLPGTQGAPHLTLAPHEMTLLLSGIDLSFAKQRKRFSLPRPASPPGLIIWADWIRYLVSYLSSHHGAAPGKARKGRILGCRPRALHSEAARAHNALLKEFLRQKEQLERLKRQQFGTRSEKFIPTPEEQQALFAPGSMPENRGFAVTVEPILDPGRALKMLFYRSLFEIERNLTERGATPQDRLAARQEFSCPLLSKMKVWMEERRMGGQVLPQSTLGKAIDHALARWETFEAFLEDASLPLSNNISERAMRGVVLGRNNYLLFGSEKAAQQGAVFYSILHSCASLGINPEEYLQDIAPRIGDHMKSRLLELTPAGWLAARNHSRS